MSPGSYLANRTPSNRMGPPFQASNPNGTPAALVTRWRPSSRFPASLTIQCRRESRIAQSCPLRTAAIPGDAQPNPSLPASSLSKSPTTCLYRASASRPSGNVSSDVCWIAYGPTIASICHPPVLRPPIYPRHGAPDGFQERGKQPDAISIRFFLNLAQTSPRASCRLVLQFRRFPPASAVFARSPAAML